MTATRRSAWALLAAACGSSGGSAGVPAAAPVGVLAGEVRDGVTLEPIDDAEVSVTAGAETLSATTDDDGRFVIEGVPAGSPLAAEVEADGYARARVWFAIDDEAGEQPQENSIFEIVVDLFDDDNSVDVRVRDGEDGEGVADAEIVVRHVAGGTTELPDALSATTDDDGRVTIDDVATWQTYVVSATANGYAPGGAWFTQGETAEVEIWLARLDGGEGKGFCGDGWCSDDEWDSCCDDGCCEDKGWCGDGWCSDDEWDWCCKDACCED
ncbi:MAG: carboxypeptidase-like regulatory domain-containing protein [Myxococcota bacterium]